MSQTDDKQLLTKAKDLVSQCDRCGTCLTVCPLFGIVDVEKSAARGKNSIVRALAAGALKPDGATLEATNFCLLCQACVDSCPNKIKTDQAMVNVRQYLTNRNGGVGIKYRMLGGIMKHKTIVKMAAMSLGIIRALKLGGLVPFGMAPEEYTKEQYTSVFKGPAALGGKTELWPAEGTPDKRVADFEGGGMKMMFPAAAEASQRTLKKTTALVVRENGCCGIPHLAHGMLDDFIALAKENIKLYEDVDIVVTDCGSCGGTLKHVADYLADDPEWKERAATFSKKVMDFSEYLVKAGYKPENKSNAVVTYHDPCHLVRGQGIKAQPRELLKASVGSYVEMKEADKCCGGAGTFHMDYPEASKQIVGRKQANIENTGAQIVTTGCPVCLVQLTKAAEASGGKFKAMHISQVI